MSCLIRELRLEDYDEIDKEVRQAHNISAEISGMFRPQNPHRMWEYGFTIKHLVENKVKTVLDVGGTGSPLAYILTQLGFEVTVIDRDNTILNFRRQSPKIRFIPADFLELDVDKYDATLAISVIEHVERDKEFVRKLIETGDMTFLTTDAHKSGSKLHLDHLRTYNPKTLANLSGCECEVVESDQENIFYDGFRYNFMSFLKI